MTSALFSGFWNVFFFRGIHRRRVVLSCRMPLKRKSIQQETWALGIEVIDGAEEEKMFISFFIIFKAGFSLELSDKLFVIGLFFHFVYNYETCCLQASWQVRLLITVLLCNSHCWTQHKCFQCRMQHCNCWQSAGWNINPFYLAA